MTIARKPQGQLCWPPKHMQFLDYHKELQTTKLHTTTEHSAFFHSTYYTRYYEDELKVTHAQGNTGKNTHTSTNKKRQMTRRM